MKKLVEVYFAAVAAMRTGDKKAITKMMSLWGPDGVLHVMGGRGEDGWPRSKVYEGPKAIRARFEAMLKSDKVTLTDGRSAVGLDVKFVVGKIREDGNTMTATVTATVSTEEDSPRSFQIEEKKFVFTHESGKLQKVVEDLSWANAVVSRRLESVGTLSVTDIGRLTLAAWAIA